MLPRRNEKARMQNDSSAAGSAISREAICELVLDDQRLRNDIWWSVSTADPGTSHPRVYTVAE